MTRILFCVVLFSFLSTDVQAIKGVDVFYKEANSQKNIRIVLYDIHKQKLESVADITGFSESALEEQLDKVVHTLPLTVQIDGSVILKEHFLPTEYMVRASVLIDASNLDQGVDSSYALFDLKDQIKIYDKRYTSLYRTRQILDQKRIERTIVKGGRNISQGTPLSVDYFDEKKRAPLKTLESFDNTYRGVIGETATELTMLSFGYNQILSKYEGNHGLDGIFIAESDRPECFITESKCWQEEQRASKTMEKFLAEDDIWKKVKRGLEKVKEPFTQSGYHFLDTFIKDYPESVFKLAHRICLDGQSQCAIKPLGYDAYMRESGRPTLSSLAGQLATLSVAERARLNQLLGPGFWPSS